jgi:hypothetical protein
MPKERAPVVGPSAPCALCSRATSQLTDAHCAQCWALRQVLTAYVPLLLADPEAAPKVRALLERALATKPEPPTEGA